MFHVATRRRVASVLLVVTGLLWHHTTSGEGARPVSPAFERFRSLIGEWRGTGQVRRGSSRGAWQETAEWRYDFTAAVPQVVLDVTDGQHVDKIVFRADESQADAKALDVALVAADGSTVPLVVESADSQKLVLVQNSTAEAESATDSVEQGSTPQALFRLTVTSLSEKRTLLLIENARPGSTRFRRVAEVGYTRAGTRLASDSAGGPECIVTGGKGTIQVSFEGKTYYVCCTGCKQAFEADPAAIIADAAERKKKD